MLLIQSRAPLSLERSGPSHTSTCSAKLYISFITDTWELHSSRSCWLIQTASTHITLGSVIPQRKCRSPESRLAPMRILTPLTNAFFGETSVPQAYDKASYSGKLSRVTTRKVMTRSLLILPGARLRSRISRRSGSRAVYGDSLILNDAARNNALSRPRERHRLGVVSSRISAECSTRLKARLPLSTACQTLDG